MKLTPEGNLRRSESEFALEEKGDANVKQRQVWHKSPWFNFINVLKAAFECTDPKAQKD